MSNMLILAPLPFTIVNLNGNGDPANLLTPDPKEAYFGSGGTGNPSLRLDLGAAQDIDTLFLGFTTNYVNANWWTGTSTAAMAARGLINPAPATSVIAGRQHFLARLPAPVSARYVDISPARGPGDATLGIVMVGKAFQPTHNKEWGSGRGVIDTGSKDSLLGGGFGIGEGARKGRFRWRLGDLADAEVETLYNLALDRGETSSVLVVEDPDATVGLNNRLHYGLLDRIEEYERRNHGQTAWAMSVTQWV